MIHVNSVTAALHDLLSTDPVLVSSGFHIEEAAAFNQDLNATPWVGIYHGNLLVDPHTVGGNRPWEGQLEVFLYVQEGGHGSGRDVTRRLNQCQARILELLNADRTLGGTVQNISGMEIAPFQRDLAEDTWLFSNEIALKTTVRG